MRTVWDSPVLRSDCHGGSERDYGESHAAQQQVNGPGQCARHRSGEPGELYPSGVAMPREVSSTGPLDQCS